MVRATVVAVFVLTFLLQPYRIPSASMENTLLVGDFLLVNKQALAPAGKWQRLLPYRFPQHGEVVVFHHPEAPHALLVKRVEAIAGDTLSLHGGQVFLNGHPQTETYTVFTPAPRNRFRDDFPNLQDRDPDTLAAWWVQLRTRIQNGALPVPASAVFVMGDNRNDSQDSRYWGFVPVPDMVGLPMVVYFSVREQTQGTLWQRLRHGVRWRRLMSVVH